MKVLQINLVCNIGSTGKICNSIAQFLLSQGHDVLNCSVAGEFIHDYDYRYEVYLESFLKKVFYKFCEKKRWQVFCQTKRLLKKIDEFQPDVIHIHNIHHNVVDFQMLLSKIARKQIPVVYTLHDMWPMTGGCYSDLIFECSEKMNGCKKCNMTLGNNADCNSREAEKLLRIKKELYGKQDKICFVAVSQWLHRQTDNSILSEYRREVIRNGIDISVFKRYEMQDIFPAYAFQGKRNILACASYWMERKGLSDFFELEKLLGDEYQIILVGHCNEKVKKHNGNIVFVDHIDNSKLLAQLYSTADVYVSLSKSETFGLTLAEAACCGAPVIAYDNTGMTEVVELVGGVAVPNGNIKQVAENIKMICNSNVYRSDVEMARKNFSELEMCRKYLELYETML